MNAPSNRFLKFGFQLIFWLFTHAKYDHVATRYAQKSDFDWHPEQGLKAGSVFYHFTLRSFLIHLYCMKLTCVFVCPVSAADVQTDDRVLGSQSCVPTDRPPGEEDARQDVRVSRHQTVTRASLRPESLRRHGGFILLSVKVHSSRSPDRENTAPCRTPRVTVLQINTDRQTINTQHATLWSNEMYFPTLTHTTLQMKLLPSRPPEE